MVWLDNTENFFLLAPSSKKKRVVLGDASKEFVPNALLLCGKQFSDHMPIIMTT